MLKKKNNSSFFNFLDVTSKRGSCSDDLTCFLKDFKNKIYKEDVLRRFSPMVQFQLYVYVHSVAAMFRSMKKRRGYDNVVQWLSEFAEGKIDGKELFSRIFNLHKASFYSSIRITVPEYPNSTNPDDGCFARSVKTSLAQCGFLRRYLNEGEVIKGVAHDRIWTLPYLSRQVFKELSNFDKSSTVEDKRIENEKEGKGELSKEKGNNEKEIKENNVAKEEKGVKKNDVGKEEKEALLKKETKNIERESKDILSEAKKILKYMHPSVLIKRRYLEDPSVQRMVVEDFKDKIPLAFEYAKRHSDLVSDSVWEFFKVNGFVREESSKEKNTDVGKIVKLAYQDMVKQKVQTENEGKKGKSFLQAVAKKDNEDKTKKIVEEEMTNKESKEKEGLNDVSDNSKGDEVKNGKKGLFSFLSSKYMIWIGVGVLVLVVLLIVFAKRKKKATRKSEGEVGEATSLKKKEVDLGQSKNEDVEKEPRVDNASSIPRNSTDEYVDYLIPKRNLPPTIKQLKRMGR